MTKTTYVYKRQDGGTINCYGDIEEDSAFYVACSFNESHKDREISFIDTIKFNTWQKVCELLEKNLSKEIEQIETV
jgi:hypothetical protein